MKKILLLLLMSVFFTGCNGEYIADRNSKIITIKDCIDENIYRDGDSIVKSGKEGMLKYELYDGDTSVYIILENGMVQVDKSCIKLDMDDTINILDVKIPDYMGLAKDSQPENSSKYAVIEEYLSFEKTCKEYSKLFGLKFEKLGITSEDVLICQGLEKEQVEQELAIIRKYLAAQRK